jgi:hypothetical protein
MSRGRMPVHPAEDESGISHQNEELLTPKKPDTLRINELDRDGDSCGLIDPGILVPSTKHRKCTLQVLLLPV